MEANVHETASSPEQSLCGSELFENAQHRDAIVPLYRNAGKIRQQSICSHDPAGPGRIPEIKDRSEGKHAPVRHLSATSLRDESTSIGIVAFLIMCLCKAAKPGRTIRHKLFPAPDSQDVRVEPSIPFPSSRSASEARRREVPGRHPEEKFRDADLDDWPSKKICRQDDCSFHTSRPRHVGRCLRIRRVREMLKSVK